MKGKDSPVQQPLSATPANHLYRGDCLSVLDRIEDNSIDLIYIDPPFYSQRHYETIWGENAERFAFEDRWQGGIQTYINYLTTRCRRMYDKLKPTGSFYVHLDWHIGHYMKAELDKIFGYHNFQNEIIWYYKGAGVSKRRYGRRHDNIFFYTKGKTWTFNADAGRIPYARTTVERFKHYIGNVRDGRDFGLQKLNPRGKHPDDVWEIPIVAPSAKVRVGYPTQKPLPLLRRIVGVSSNPADLVLDAFCGCGTTMEAAQELDRRWIGIDISQAALRVVQNRLRKIGAPPAETHNMIQNVDELRELSWQEFQAWAIDAVQGRHNPRKPQMGIDGFTFLEHHPIEVKQMDDVGRPVLDNFVGALKRERETRGMIIGLSFTKGAFAEAARLERENKIKIELLTCRQILEEDLPFRTIA
jgi:DNA modification methylase